MNRDHRPPLLDSKPIRFKVVDLLAGIEYLVAVPRTKKAVERFEVFDGAGHIIGLEEYPELSRMASGDEIRAAFARKHGRKIVKQAAGQTDDAAA